MTTSEILLLFQTIIALLALLVSVVHLMDDRKKDDSYGSNLMAAKGKSTKRNDRPTLPTGGGHYFCNA